MIQVEFTALAATREGQQLLQEVIGKNGRNLDGTFTIHTVSEIDRLTWMGLATQKILGADGKDVPAYKIKSVIREPTRGAISPDAFLNMVLDQDQRPLNNEMKFIEEFECLQTRGTWCQ
jgi:EAL domain-containing protein (putative c-di-GMP-specific phosphodiesterase class I)